MTTNIATGILIPADMDKQPHVVPIAGVDDIQCHVGGFIDAVTTEVDHAEFGVDDARDFVLVGYVHDEGLLLDMPTNHRATVMFQRHVVGDVVVLSGTNPVTENYDGDNYDVPRWYAERVLDGTLDWVIANAMDTTDMIHDAIELALTDGLFTSEDITMVMEIMEAHADGETIDPEDREVVNMVLMTCVLYSKGRSIGAVPKYDERGWELMKDVMTNGITDEMLEDFLGNGGQ